MAMAHSSSSRKPGAKSPQPAPIAYCAQHGRCARHICRVEPWPELAAVAVDDSQAGLGAVEERCDDQRRPAIGDDVADRGQTQQNPLSLGAPGDPRRGLVRPHDRAFAHGWGDRGGGGQQGRFGPGDDVGDGAPAEGQAEHLDQQAGEALEADRLGDLQVDDERVQPRPKRRTLRKAVGRGCCDTLAAARAGAVVAVDASDGRADRRQVDVVGDMGSGQVGGTEPTGAMRAGVRCRLDNPVRVVGKGAGDAGAAGMVRLLAAGRRRA